MFKDLFGKPKYVTVRSRERHDRDDISPDSHLWTKCTNCNAIIFNKKLVENLMVCPECNYHFRISARDRLAITVDEDSFQEFARDIQSEDPLGFPQYREKLLQAKIKTGLDEAVITGEAAIDNMPVVIGVMDFTFLGGSMGSVVGEKITIAAERSLETQRPLILFTTAGGARMQEGLVSLMQMAKTSAAVRRLDKAGILYICVMTDPTSGGVTASFASIADIIIAETGALIAFAGPRVIKQTISADLPEGFQRAEFLLEHGMVDMVVDRKDMRSQLARILKIHVQGVRYCG
ncbi:MAG: acetyl-CoA carboxylase carboxyltransferase subunit beta [Halanaerobiaceae bacterium]|jgi:acetyl-CoA carboxylase carboxyl transferase subunit beta|nr:acetyl-CoA carboxylase carboxyltransferase subunit beta [Halanaerobiaceae bacterium]